MCRLCVGDTGMTQTVRGSGQREPQLAKPSLCGKFRWCCMSLIACTADSGDSGTSLIACMSLATQMVRVYSPFRYIATRDMCY